MRPHDIDLVPTGHGDASARIEVVEPLGAVTLIHVRVDGVRDGLVRIVVPPDTRIEVGSEVSFRLRRDRLHFFDKVGRRMDLDRFTSVA